MAPGASRSWARPVIPAQLGGVSGPVRESVEACRRHYLMACRWPDGLPLPGAAATAGSYLLAARDLLQCRACQAPDLGEQAGTALGTVPGCPCSALDRRRLPRHHPHAGVLGACSCSVSSGSPATKPPGRCCRSCGGRWCDPSATGYRAPSSWTRPMSVGLRKGGAAAGSATARRRSWPARSRFAAAGSGRIRLAVVPDLSAATFARFAEEAITPGSTVLTDGWHSLQGPERELRRTGRP